MQINLRRIGMLGLTFSCLLSAQAADEASMMCASGMLACGISFQTPIQATPSPLTPLTPTQAIYTIVNNDEVNAVNIALDLTEIDSLDDTNAVQFDESMTCPESGTLGAGATCTIVLDFAPTVVGDLNWNLTVTPTGYAAQRPLTLALESTIGIPYASAGGFYTDTDGGNYPFLTMSSDAGGTWNYFLDDTTTPLPNNYDPTSSLEYGITSTSCSGSTCVAGGQYFDGDNYYLFAASNAGGSWSYTYDSSSAAIPLDFLSSSDNPVSVGCSGSTCMLGGQYTLTAGEQYPLGIISTDGGLSWAVTISSALNPPPDISESCLTAGLNGISCIDATSCVVAGVYTNTNDWYYPLLAYSTYSDDAWTWTYPDISSQIPSDLDGKFLSLEALSCYESTCIAGGNYGPPVMYMSFDGGEAWSLMIDSSSPSTVVPSDWNFRAGGYINGVNCSESACAVAGTYVDDSYDNWPYMATAVISNAYPCTNASNCNWIITIDSSSIFADWDSSGFGTNLNEVSCTQTTCIAVGTYVSETDGNQYPLAITYTFAGEDTGIAYTVDRSTIQANMPTDYNDNSGGELTDINCSNWPYCTASGYYASELHEPNTYPFLITSQDAGHTWAYTIDGTTDTLPVNFVSGQFNANNAAPPTVKK